MKKRSNKPEPVAQTSGTAMVYVAISGYINGESWALCYTFDLQEARKALEYKLYLLTAYERRGLEQYIEGFEIPVNAGETAEEAYKRCFRDDINDFLNPDFYEDFKVDDKEEDDEEEDENETV